MPFSNTDGLSIRGGGKSNRDVVLNEIKEARKEVQMLAQTLGKLEAIVSSKPDTGTVKLSDVLAAPLLTNHDLKPLLGWMLSLYESFHIIGLCAVGMGYASNAQKWFSSNIAKAESISVSVSK